MQIVSTSLKMRLKLETEREPGLDRDLAGELDSCWSVRGWIHRAISSQPRLVRKAQLDRVVVRSRSCLGARRLYAYASRTADSYFDISEAQKIAFRMRGKDLGRIVYG
jgi:hypothetical protein